MLTNHCIQVLYLLYYNTSTFRITNNKAFNNLLKRQTDMFFITFIKKNYFKNTQIYGSIDVDLYLNVFKKKDQSLKISQVVQNTTTFMYD